MRFDAFPLPSDLWLLLELTFPFPLPLFLEDPFPFPLLLILEEAFPLLFPLPLCLAKILNSGRFNLPLDFIRCRLDCRRASPLVDTNKKRHNII